MFIRLDKILQQAIHVLFLALFFFLPLIFWVPSSEVFELPKMLFVYAITTLITAAWAMRMTGAGQLMLRRTPLDIPIVLFLISQIISTLYSIDPHTSWLGYYSRFNGGLLSTISYTLLYYAFVSNHVRYGTLHQCKVPYLTHFVVPTIFSSVLVVSLYAILQHFGIDRDFWVQDVVNRVFSTQGQPNWLAALVVMVIPLTWARMIKLEDQDGQKGHSSTSFLFFLLLVALLFTKSRSGLIGLAIADIAFWSLVLVASRGPSSRGRSSLLRPILVVHCSLLIALGIISNPLRDFIFRSSSLTSESSSPATSSLPSLDGSITLRKSAQGGTESGDIRRVVWKGAWEIVKRHPLIGTGPETFAYTYWSARPVEHNYTSEWNFLYNKAHNEWLNLAANTGLFGLGSHILLLIWFSILVLKRVARGPSSRGRSSRGFLDIALLASLLAAEAVNFFGFSTVTVGAYRYLFMAMAVVHRKRQVASDKKNAPPPVSQFKLQGSKLKIILLVGIFLVSCYSLLAICFRFFADLSYRIGRSYNDAGYADRAIPLLQNSVDLLPDEPVFRSELAEAQGLFSISTTDQKQAQKNAENSIYNFRIVMRENPFNVNMIRTTARVTFALGAIDESFYREGIQLMEYAGTLAPTNPSIPYSMGIMESALGEKEQAKKYFQRALKLKSDYQEAVKALENLD